LKTESSRPSRRRPKAPGDLPLAPESSPAPQDAVSGTICVHPAGYGFVTRDSGDEDIFVSAKNRGPALDGDRVAIVTFAGWKGTEGRVISVLQHGRAKITGVVRTAGRAVYLEPDDPRIPGRVSLDLPEAFGESALEGAGASGRFGPAGARLDKYKGMSVVAEIMRYPEEPGAAFSARVLGVLGDPEDPRTEVAKIIACADIPDEFPDDVKEAASRISQEVRESDLCDRVDLRDRDFLTIDPETARDFDDAVCVEDGPRPGVERLWVAVADVSHYVRPNTALDREARIRGVSVYLPDRSLPMLPHALSSGICSLNPDTERLAMVARLDVDESGRVLQSQFVTAVIRSRARLDYAGVAAALKGDLRGPRARYREHLPQLRRMQALSQRLRALRCARGALELDLPEAVVLLDEDDPSRVRVRDVKRSRALPEVREAYRLVEDFMLAANEAVARFFAERGRDTIFRVHARPKEARLAEFISLAQSLGLSVAEEELKTPRGLRDLLGRIAGTPMERSLSYLLLRSMKQATYDVENIGHFGLAAPEYLHFTSPIRRYPDLVVHRLLKWHLHAEGLPSGGGFRDALPPREELEQLCSACSGHERRAMEAEREVVDMYRAFLMREQVGEEFSGVVTGVTAFGLFIEIAEPYIEGRVKLEKLGHERFDFDERTLRLVGERSGRAFALGDAVRVRIESVSVPRRHVDFELVQAPLSAAADRSDGRHRPRSPRTSYKR